MTTVLKNNITSIAIAALLAALLLAPGLSWADHGPTMNILSIPTTNTDGTITYDITVTNTGHAAANDVFIRSTLSANETFIDSSPNADTSYMNGNLTLVWNVPTIPVGGEYNVHLTTAVATGVIDGTTISNTVMVDGETFTAASVTTSVVTGPIIGEGGADPDQLPVTGLGSMALVIILGSIAFFIWLGLPLSKRV